MALNDIDPSRVVCVFGSSDPKEGDTNWTLAYQAGAVLAKSGYVIANGGYGGTMLAASKGAADNDGRVIGVTCSVWSSTPNPFVTDVVETDSLFQRVETLIELGKAGYVCLPGSTGTLVELATTWELMFKRFIAKRPLVCLGDFWTPLVEMMTRERKASGGFVSVAKDVQDLSQYFPVIAKGER